MNTRVVAVLLVALLISAGATFLVFRVMGNRSAQNSRPATTDVVMAVRPLEIGTLVKDTDLTVGPWVGQVPAGMVTKKEAALNRGVVAPIYQGEALMESRLAVAGAGGGLAATIPPGMRAVAVRVNDIVGVAGFVVPGMRVDVLISGARPDLNRRMAPRSRPCFRTFKCFRRVRIIKRMQRANRCRFR